MVERKITGVVVCVLLWAVLMIALCVSPKAHGATRMRNVATRVTPREIDQQFQWAYQAMGKTKPGVCVSSSLVMIDFYFQRAYRDLGKTKPFIVTTNRSSGLDNYFNRLYQAINGGG